MFTICRLTFCLKGPENPLVLLKLLQKRQYVILFFTLIILLSYTIALFSLIYTSLRTNIVLQLDDARKTIEADIENLPNCFRFLFLNKDILVKVSLRQES